MGTSHRKEPVLSLVGHIQQMIADLYSIPSDHRVVLGNGGSTTFWDMATCSLVEKRASLAVFGEFSRKFAKALTKAPFLEDPYVNEAEVGSACLPTLHADADTYGWVHNETSTGACVPVSRLDGASEDALMLIDATSAAGGLDADLSGIDAYYLAPQKNFSADGGLWIAVCSPAALERAERLCARDDRWVPDSLNLALAAKNSAKRQTLNTPAIATLILLASQLEWMIDLGGMTAIRERVAHSSQILYSWAENNPHTTPFVSDPRYRSPVVGTIDFDESVDASEVSAILRRNGIVDVDSYRSLKRNQLRIGMFPAVEPDDVLALTRCIDWTIDRLLDA